MLVQPFTCTSIDRPTSRETQWMEHWPPCKSTPQKEQSKQRKSRQENNQNLTDKQAREKKIKNWKKKNGEENSCIMSVSSNHGCFVFMWAEACS